MTPDDPYLDLHVDPYPDAGAELLEPPADSEGQARDEARRELSEDDSRLLAALSRPQPAVVTAVEEQDLPARASGRPGPRAAGPLAPVFREPTG